MKIRNLVLATMMAIPLNSVADDTAKQQPAPAAPTTTDKTTNKNDKAKRAKLSQAEIGIVAHMHHVNRMEITMGKQAQKQGTTAVKNYGEMLVRDHATADKELVAFAKQRGIAKIPADKPANAAEKAERAEQMANMKKLKTLKGEDFDRAYLQLMVASHEKELAKSDPAITLARDAELKMMLESRKTVLQRHADAARELQKGNVQASIDATQTGPKPAPAPSK